MADPPDLSIASNQAMIAAGIEPDGTRSGIALDAQSRLILSPTSGGGLPADAATATNQTNGTQVSNATPSTPYNSSAYESGAVLKSSSGTFRSLCVQISAALLTGTYYAQVFSGSASVPGDGAVTFFRGPLAIDHVLGLSEKANFDEGIAGVLFATGCTTSISSTEFTKTAVASGALFFGSVV